jgi:hypothetical protein
MSTNTIETKKTPDASAPQRKGKRTAAKKAKPVARQPEKMGHFGGMATRSCGNGHRKMLLVSAGVSNPARWQAAIATTYCP